MLNDKLFRNSVGGVAVPSISSKANTLWISYLGDSDDIPLEVMSFRKHKTYPTATGPSRILLETDYAHQPVWYHPSCFWWPFNPTGAPTGSGSDSLAYIFDYQTSIATTEEVYNAYDSDGRKLGERHAGCMLDKEWTRTCLIDSERLGRACVGNLPAVVVSSDIEHSFLTEREAKDAASEAKHVILSQLGYITWFLSCRSDWCQGLPVAEAVYIASLQLWERLRRGVLVDIESYWTEMNIPHWLKENVPMHYQWTYNLDTIEHFFILSPTFLRKYFGAVETNGGSEVPIESLALYLIWSSCLLCYDLYSRDLLRAPLGRIARTFRLQFVLKMVDELYWDYTYCHTVTTAPDLRPTCPVPPVRTRLCYPPRPPLHLPYPVPPASAPTTALSTASARSGRIHPSAPAPLAVCTRLRYPPCPPPHPPYPVPPASEPTTTPSTASTHSGCIHPVCTRSLGHPYPPPCPPLHPPYPVPPASTPVSTGTTRPGRLPRLHPPPCLYLLVGPPLHLPYLVPARLRTYRIHCPTPHFTAPHSACPPAAVSSCTATPTLCLKITL
ncbi:hypothetical protein C8J57DRAFT_1528755 [Mycena rebaudengoi]|nr:hypothetical protein C8J57DRAFT_1528755 [Mycena rebaudengoi]